MKHSLCRRRFLVLAAASPLLASLPAASAKPSDRNLTVGIALGGGGARGLAHVEMLAVLDELGINPRLIAGTSMGAVMGGLYATGRSAAEIRSIVNDALARRSGSAGFFRKELLEWIHLIDPAINREILLSGSDFIAFIHQQIRARTFAELKIPRLVVAADIQRREQVTLHGNELIPALEVSIAFPGLFSPVVIDDRVLVDGRIVNPVPYDLLIDRCDITIAVEVAGGRTFAPQSNPPSNTACSHCSSRSVHSPRGWWTAAASWSPVCARISLSGMKLKRANYAHKATACCRERPRS